MKDWRRSNRRSKTFSLWLLAAVLAGVALMPPRITQPLWYHDFADQRACFGLPNCLDTASNTLFVLAGAAGLHFLYSSSARRTFIDSREALPCVLFFFATMLVGFGSGFYHLAPANDQLMWDRAAVALALMAWFAATLCERVSLTSGLRLPLLTTAGLSSVVYWGWSEAQGLGDLRPDAAHRYAADPAAALATRRATVATATSWSSSGFIFWPCCATSATAQFSP